MAQTQKIQTRIRSVMEDPGAEPVARVYAEAFLNAIGQDQLEGTLEEARSFEEVLRAQPEFARLLTSARISEDDKLALIDRVVAGRASDLFTNFLRVLARHNRLDLLSVILRQAALMAEKRSGRRRVQVTTAQPLHDGQLEALRGRLAAVLPFEPVVEAETDPHLLGGVRIRVGDTVYDGSLRARLKQLRHRVRERSLHEIQSGRDRFRHSEGN